MKITPLLRQWKFWLIEPELNFRRWNTQKSREEKKDLKTKIIEINTEAAKYFHYLLKSDRGKLAYNYLKGRQLSDEIIVKFGLGYSDKYSNNLYMYLKKKGYNDNELRETGLFTYDEKEVLQTSFGIV